MIDSRKENLCGDDQSSEIALLLIDIINDLDFEGNDTIVDSAAALAQTLSDLKMNLKSIGIPVIYVNDNFEKWQSDFNQIVNHCLESDVPGRVLAERLRPEKDDFFILKPKHSGFYATPLDILLQHLHVRELILTGLAGNICVLYTANDAYMRGFKLYVPQDGILSNTQRDNDYALEQMEKLLKAQILSANDLLSQLKKRLPAS